MSVILSPSISYAMQDFRPRLSSTYQPRQSLSHLVSKFESLDVKPSRADAPMPRRAKTLPHVAPGQWLSSSHLNEKRSVEEPEVPSASTFGQRHKSVAERRKLFEDAKTPGTGRSSGIRVFSRDVAPTQALSTNNQASLHAAIDPRDYVATRHSTEAVRQVRRMPRLQVARSRPPPTEEPEWPLISNSPLRASFDTYTYRATNTSVEWKPSLARERSLSRRRGESRISPVETKFHDVSSTRNSSVETGTAECTVGNVTVSKVEEEQAMVTAPVLEPQPKAPLYTTTSTNNNAIPRTESVRRKPSGLPKSETVAVSIGYPSAHSAPIPTSISHGVLFPARNSGSWAAKQSSSPLKEKIGIFESLSRQGSVADSSQSTKFGATQRPSQPHRNISKHAASLSRTASRMKATLRRISVSWERGHAERVPSFGKENAEGLGSHRETNIRTRGTGKKQSPVNHDGKDSYSRANIKRFFSPLSGPGAQPPPTPHNTIRRETDHKVSPIDSSSDSTGLLGVFNSDKTSSAQSAPAAPTPAPIPETQGDIRRPSWSKRFISRSSGSPMFARVQCKLDQPSPVRSDELKRLVTLCKDSALRRSRGQTG